MHTSYQEPAPGAKSAKFISANPLDPMIRPFGNNNTSQDQDEMQEELSRNVNSRLERAMQELTVKHQHDNDTINNLQHNPMTTTGGEISTSNYQNQQMEQHYQKQHNNNYDDNDDDDDFDDDDDDPILEVLRQKRIMELKQQHLQQIENLSKGHGQYRTITQDEFLPECIGSTVTESSPTSTSKSLLSSNPCTGAVVVVVVHFFHNEFKKCHVMDHHLQIIASKYIECKFVRIDAVKAPFFVTKFNIKTLPTLVVFQNGILVNRLIGFEGLLSNTSNNTNKSNTNNNNNKGTTSNDDDVDIDSDLLQGWLASTGAIHFGRNGRINTTDDSNNDYNEEDDDDDNHQRQRRQRKNKLYNGTGATPSSSIQRGIMMMNALDDDL